MPTTISGTNGASQCAPGSVSKDDFAAGVISGAVSQVGGVPTGAVIESGSNANGSYTKWADGTMICSGFVDLGATTFVAAAGVFYAGPFSAKPFPATFIAPPKSQLSILSSGGLSWISHGSAFASTTGTQTFFVMTTAAASQFTTLTYIAIGRWF